MGIKENTAQSLHFYPSPKNEMKLTWEAVCADFFQFSANVEKMY